MSDALKKYFKEKANLVKCRKCKRSITKRLSKKNKGLCDSCK